MKNTINRLGLFLSQAMFSAVTPPLLVPKIARLPATRLVIGFCFGRLYGNRYDDIIAAFKDEYGEPMSSAISKAREDCPGRSLLSSIAAPEPAS